MKKQTINHRKNFLRGAAQVLVLMPRREYIIPKRGDTARDAAAMRDDFATVNDDLNYAVQKYAKR